MLNIESVLREINREFVPQFEQKLRAHLASKDKDWLIEQIVRLTLDAHSLQEMDRRHIREEETLRRQARAARVQQLGLDIQKLHEFSELYRQTTREQLCAQGLLKADAPLKGDQIILPAQRSPEGEALLQNAKDVLFGLLFGDEHTKVHFKRTQRELLTLTVPRAKAGAIDFMKATTELSALGTWQDPKGAANDMRADNVVLEIEYGEVEGELIGDGVITALRLINNLEINEEILYGRMENIEQSTLVQ